MNKTKTKLVYFLKAYGHDFFKKLPKYKTAKRKDKWVKLLTFYPDSLAFDIDDGNYTKSFIKRVDLFDLDNFVL